MQGPVALFSQEFIGLNHDYRVVVLNRDLEILETVFLEKRGFPHRGVDKSLGRCLAVLLHEALIERARINTDTDRGAIGGSGGRDLFDLVIKLANIARIHSNGRASGLNRSEE